MYHLSVHVRYGYPVYAGPSLMTELGPNGAGLIPRFLGDRLGQPFNALVRYVVEPQQVTEFVPKRIAWVNDQHAHHLLSHV